MRWLKSALFISLSLNIAFIVGFIYSGKNLNNLSQSPEKRQQLLQQRLELSKDQKVLFQKLKKDVFILTDNYKQKDEELLEHYWQSLLNEDKELPHILEEMSKNQLRYRQKVTANFKILMAELNPEQRVKIVKILKRQNIFFRLIRQKPKPKPK